MSDESVQLNLFEWFSFRPIYKWCNLKFDGLVDVILYSSNGNTYHWMNTVLVVWW